MHNYPLNVTFWSHFRKDADLANEVKLKIIIQAGSSAAKEKEEKPLSKKELAAKKKVKQL